MKKIAAVFPIVFILALGGCATGGKVPVPSEASAFTMSTYVQVRAYGGGEDAAQKAVEEIDRLSTVFDRFDPSSEVARLNAAGGEEVAVSEDLGRLIDVSLKLAEETGGLFDPTIGPLVDLWGFASPENDVNKAAGTSADRAAEPPAPEEIRSRLALVDYRKMVFDGQIAALLPGMAFDPGGIAKGYAAEKAGKILKEEGVTSALIDLGHNFYALGEHPDGRAWRLAIQHPREEGAIIATIEVRDETVATSGDYQRFFEFGGKRYSHLLDPRTGYPAEGLVSVTIISPSGALADGLSTAAFIMGPERGFEFIEEYPGAEGVFVDRDLTVRYTSGLEGRIELK